MATPATVNKAMLRRTCLGDATVGVALIPCGVTSNTQARTSATGKPISITAITGRITEFGISKTGRT